MEILEERLAEDERDPSVVQPWSDAKRDILAALRK